MIYLCGLCLSVGLSAYSYLQQSEGLAEVNDLFSHYQQKEYNFKVLQLYQQKLNAVTQGLLGKDEEWQGRFLEVQGKLAALHSENSSDVSAAITTLALQDEALTSGEKKQLIGLLKKEKRTYIRERVSLNKQSITVQKELIAGTKGILKVLTYYSLGMSALFTVFVFLINLNKKNVARLESERKKRDFMLDSLDCAVILLNKDLEILSFNEKANQVWAGSGLHEGTELGELIGVLKVQNEEDELREYKLEDSPLYFALKSKRVENGLSMQVNFTTKSLNPQWFQVDMKSFRGELFLLSFINTTHLNEAKILIERQQQSLIEQSKMSALGQMSGGMAHEINNPLAIISSEAEELLEIAEEDGTVNQDDATSISQNIKKTTDRIAKIIRGLRIFSREDKGGEYEARNLNEIIKEVLIMAEEKFKTKSVKFSLILPEEKERECDIYANEVQIIQVLVNLLNNAYDAVKEQKDRKITFRWRILPQHHLFSIEDNGPGVPVQVRDKIFDPFFTTKKVGEGTGLGLSLSKSIMQNHGGDLGLEDSSQGAVFIVKIPTYVKEDENKEEEKWAS